MGGIVAESGGGLGVGGVCRCVCAATLWRLRVARTVAQVDVGCWGACAVVLWLRLWVLGRVRGFVAAAGAGWRAPPALAALRCAAGCPRWRTARGRRRKLGAARLVSFRMISIQMIGALWSLWAKGCAVGKSSDFSTASGPVADRPSSTNPQRESFRARRRSLYALWASKPACEQMARRRDRSSGARTVAGLNIAFARMGG